MNFDRKYLIYAIFFLEYYFAVIFVAPFRNFLFYSTLDVAIRILIYPILE